MLRQVYTFIFAGLFLSFSILAQTPDELSDDSVIKGQFLGKTLPVRDFATEFDFNTIDSTQVFEIKNFRNRYRKSPVERNLYPRLDALWAPNQNRAHNKVPQSSLLENFDGIPYTGVNPPDPSMAANSEYVVQMLNGAGGALYKVWNKNGVALSGAINFDSFFTGLSGYGDPIVLFDQIANRWFLSEFSSSGNKLLVAISVTNDPLGAFYTYEFQATNFPDYPKYSVWPDAYYCTANENSSSIYAFQRDSMLMGAPANMIRKTVGNLSGFGFQSLTPVSFEGSNLTNSVATFWRHVDDEAHTPSIADPFNDHVEYYTFEPNFAIPTNSSFNGPFSITVSDFDSDLNGYYSFSAIKQPNTSVRLDPLREVFMNRMNYRNFGLFESIVGCHVTDIDGTDWAGMRWYEFRKTDTTDWALYQEGTYAPDTDSRWMGSIDINSNGSICLAYSVSSTSTHPSLRYTGRNTWDSLGVMTLSEQTIISGSGSNSNNRYGDYASMCVDPSDDSTFWFTGEYNQSSNWDTRIVQIQLDDTCNGLTAVVNHAGVISCPGDANATISVHAIGGPTGVYEYSLDNITFQSSNLIANLPVGDLTLFIKDGNCISNVGVTISGPDSIYISNLITNVSCFDAADGEILVIANGGTAPLQYSVDSTNWASNTIIDGLNPGLYTIFVQDAHNCISTLDSIEITEPTQLIVTDSIVPASSSSAMDGKIYLNVTGGSPTYYYSMDSLSFKTSNFFTNLSSGTYTTYVVDANGCSVTTKTELLSLAVNELNLKNYISIYPNPTSGIFSINFSKEISTYPVEVSIRDISGKLISSTKLNPNSAQYEYKFDLGKNAKGVYFITITAHQQSETVKVILE